MSGFEVEQVLIVDRSTLERYATCPAQARMIDLGYSRHAGKAAVSGEEVHKAISETVTNYIESQGSMTPGDIREDLERNLRCARPDVQPDAIDGMRASLWSFASFLKDLHFSNILRYDGGDGKRSGQLAADIEHLNVRVTAEVDFLHATASPEVLDLEDWKTGRGKWDIDDVHSSFQFQCYAWLIFENYESIEEVRVRVWSTRFNTKTRLVVFTRSVDMPNIRSRIGTTVGEWLRNKDRDPEDCIVYPSFEACRICDVAYKCPEADREPREISDSIDAYVDQMKAKQVQLDAMHAAASAYVDKIGRDIVTPAGNRFGTEKPKANRKPVKTLYSIKSDAEAEA